MIQKPKVYVVFYSTYGHVKILAENVRDGVVAGGGDCKLFQIEETLSEEVLGKMNAPPKDKSIPTIKPAELADADGIIFGFPTRFGMMPAQVKAFFDNTTALWKSGGLVGKTAGIFTSCGTQGGGMETTCLTSITQFAHHGMVFVPIGYTCPEMDNDAIHGGSAYGAGTIAGPMGERKPTPHERKLAQHQGKHFAGITHALVVGKQSINAAQTQTLKEG
eukprot:GHVU01029066.1.p1 GENE.GHVU01029066.1~~GHVU01029066.1.p1  ORF type:complete len:219 (+),score=34.30 GHVU01029066.1:92-748(+)